MWKEIKGYKWPYRVSDMGIVEKFYQGKWVEIKPTVNSGRAHIMMQKPDRRVRVPVVWLVADAYMGGRRKGMDIIHKDGSKLNNAAYNLKFSPRKETGKLSCQSRRRPVFKVDPDGNVVDIFRSVKEASVKEHIAKEAIRQRCVNKVQNPFRLNGYNYQYEDTFGRKKRGKNSDQPAWE